MQRMSFNLTTKQIVAGRALAAGLAYLGPGKTVTRRQAHTWARLKPGDILLAVDKSMGLRAGERSKVLAVIRVVHIRVEPLLLITQEDCTYEGFPEKSPSQFIWMLADHYGYTLAQAEDLDVRRIEFEYVVGQAEVAALGEADARAKAARKARERKVAVRGVSRCGGPLEYETLAGMRVHREGLYRHRCAVCGRQGVNDGKMLTCSLEAR